MVALLLVLLPAGLSPEPTWKAGLARAVITPREPVWMSGYAGKREATGKLHDLWVKVLPNWRRNAKALRRFGYKPPEDTAP